MLTRTLTMTMLAAAVSCASTRNPTATAATPTGAAAGARERKEDGGRAPLLIENARIYGHPEASALLIAGNRIEKIGGPELRAWTASTSFDAEGGLVVPGFHDAHIHMLSGGLALTRVQLDDAKSVDDAVARVRAWADAHPDAAWVTGRGWSYDISPKGTLPTAAMLDKVVADRPVVLEAYDGHTMWLNTKALALAGITKDTVDPADGKIARDASGNPTGALLEGAEVLVEKVLPKETRAEKKEALAQAAAACAQLGITGVDAIESDLDAWDLLLELEREGRLPLSRVNLILPIEGNFDSYSAMRERGTERVKLTGVKGFVDGVVESRTAYLKQPYATPPAGERGVPLIPPDKLNELVREASKRHFVVTLHAIGDAAVAIALDAFDAAGAGRTGLALKHRVEHIEVLDHVDAARFLALGAVASMQPYHAVPYEPDPNAGAWSENLGKERLARTFAWRTLVDAKAPLVFGSDWPVFTNDPIAGLAVALTRQNEHAFPPGGWNGQQKLDVDVAMRAYSGGRALDEGKPADLVVLPAAVDLAKPGTLWNKRPILVVAGGARVR